MSSMGKTPKEPLEQEALTQGLCLNAVGIVKRARGGVGCRSQGANIHQSGSGKRAYYNRPTAGCRQDRWT